MPDYIGYLVAAVLLVALVSYLRWARRSWRAAFLEMAFHGALILASLILVVHCSYSR